VYEEVKSSIAFTHLGPDKREDTKWDENNEDFTTSNGASGAVAMRRPREPVAVMLSDFIVSCFHL
jgi:hypothetical protein